MYLCLSKGEQQRKVFIIDDVAALNSVPYEDLRISPIFPVSQTIPPLTPDLTSCYILFLFPKVTFSTIGRLCGRLNDERINNLYFTHGLASLVVIATDKAILSEISDIVRSEVSASECWTIRDGVISESPEIVFPISTIPQVILPDFSVLPVDVQALLTEYSSVMRAAVVRASQYLPFHLRILDGINSQIVELVDFLIFLYSEDPQCVETRSAEDIAVKEDAKRRLQHAKAFTDRILQVNGALSYVVTQGYAGVVPILEHECPLFSFSLLGIGTAFAAISKIYESVSIVFAEHPIARVIKDQFEVDFTEIPIFKEDYADYNVDHWRKYEKILDGKLDLTTRRKTDQMFHLSYFSGTQGFRESLYGISAAIQTITSCAMPRWTLLTLTHEYLHAHVRALMAVLFKEATEEEFKELYAKYLQIGTADEASLDTNLRQRLSFIILSACEYMLITKTVATGIRDCKSGKADLPELTHTQALKLLVEYNTEINEYIVHSLDFLYFYESNREIYIQLLWLSWSTIPAIYEKLNHYLLRTLLAISVDIRGDIDHRFQASCQLVRDTFNNILASGKADDPFIIKQAIDLLQDDREMSALRQEFYGTVRLADLSRFFFHSKSLHHLIKEDDQQLLDVNGTPYYPLKPLEFTDVNIQSPIAFVADRAIQNLRSAMHVSFESLLREGCWELIVIASAALSEVSED